MAVRAVEPISVQLMGGDMSMPGEKASNGGLLLSSVGGGRNGICTGSGMNSSMTGGTV